ncbi:MAG: transcription-repair coupling factor [Lentisphaeria bacterium]|nr:transcription-repair coupling factor [Lentisphaeria bacterium]
MSSNWQKKVKIFLSEKDFSDHSGTDQQVLALPVLRACLHHRKTVAAVMPDTAGAEHLEKEVRELAAVFFPELTLRTVPECGRGKLLFPGGETRRARALDDLLNQKYDLVIGSINSLLGPAQAPAEVQEAALILKPGMELSPSLLLEKLVALDYDDEYEASVSGEFAKRGGIIDLFSPAHDAPCRVEFFGDTIDTLRLYSPQTQRSTGSIGEYRVIGRSGITAGGAADSDVFAYFERIPWHLLAVHPEECREKAARYLPQEALERFNDLLHAQAQKNDSTLLFDAGEIPDGVPIGVPDILPSVFLNAALSDTPEARKKAEALNKELLLRDIRATVSGGGSVVLFCDHREDIPVLKEWCLENKLPLAQIELDSLHISSGFRLPEQELLALSESELNAAGFRSTASLKEEAAPLPKEEQPVPFQPKEEFFLADLEAGDYAVHLDHGIGIYRGFKTLTTNGVSREVLVVEYKEGRLLYVPLLQAHKLSRYLGAAGKVPLHTLGGKKWDKDKDEARQGVRSYAAEMLRMQAMRQAVPGISFRRSAAMKSFLRDFPFEDTGDQKRATVEILKDMSSTRPMDRLLCGDVGYGKTEIAMRAAFTAVSAGFQVAVLAPTTVLVQQHYRSFVKRFAKYPVTIGELSRLRSTAEQNKVMEQTASGGIDIVVGTHRICTEKIRFKNLGLVIIDEEQRFGVNHKERLRRFRAEADVLAMSATPIPRTLYLAMAGARDMSTLATAPKLRLPVRTIISPEDDALVLSAINAELARGGQVYYLHNRVKTIEDCAAKLRNMIPHARIAVAHGQMAEKELEQAMSKFLSGETDVLVCSTIIESGLDVPNANTMLIDRADRFGLAELYQLRGRVGRWKNQAYCYLFLPRSQLVSSDARKRLAAIRRCSHQGAGFQLALRDLEIRGSGNILGVEQSGHLNLIGFDLYCHLLKQEVAKLKGKKAEILPETEIGLDFVTFSLQGDPKEVLVAAFTKEYIGGERLRLDVYRRLAALETWEETEDFAEELADRFGALPPEAKNLIAFTKLRIAVARSGYRCLNVQNGRVTLLNPGGTVYRTKEGRQPVIDSRNPPLLKLKLLTDIVLEAGKR